MGELVSFSAGVATSVDDDALAWLAAIPPEQREQLVRVATAGLAGPTVDKAPAPPLADDWNARRQPPCGTSVYKKFSCDWWAKHSSMDTATAVATMRLWF